MRHLVLGLALLVPVMAAADPVAPVTAETPDRALRDWAAAFRLRALAQGIRPETFDAAFRDLRPDAEALTRDRNQTEFVRTLWDYLDRAVSEKRITEGQAALARHAGLLDRIEATYGVEKEILVAVWGIETSYGANRGSHPLIPALATLAHDGRRAAFFEAQLIAALKILDRGDIAPDAMRGSWAGAMGHTQFMPTSYLAIAQDFDGDGRRDIWSDDPADALASTAAYLAQSGWRKGQPWGIEVRLPAHYDFAESGKAVRHGMARWQALGLRAADGGALPDHGEAALLLPGGAQGAAFLIFGNFRALARYNPADAYVVAVGHLADRLTGAGPILGDWPRGDRALLDAERHDLQRLLTAAGYDTQGVDGRIGPNTLAALRAWQKAQGLTPDGYANEAVLNRLRGGA